MLFKGVILCPSLQDVKQVSDVPRVSMGSLSSKYPTDNLYCLLKLPLLGNEAKRTSVCPFKCK